MTPLDGFEVSEFTDETITHPVYVRGSGPGVLLLHELPGMVPQCVELARLIAQRGFTVFMPLLFGEAGAPPASCFTGGFVLSLFIDDLMLAPVICQPGLPFKSFKPGAGSALGVSPDDLKEVVASSAPILGFRFQGDKICPPERFGTLTTKFGNRFEKHELPGDKHSVMTLDFVNDPKHPTFQARERLMSFLHERLGVPAP